MKGLIILMALGALPLYAMDANSQLKLNKETLNRLSERISRVSGREQHLPEHLSFDLTHAHAFLQAQKALLEANAGSHILLTLKDPIAINNDLQQRFITAVCERIEIHCVNVQQGSQ